MRDFMSNKIQKIVGMGIFSFFVLAAGCSTNMVQLESAAARFVEVSSLPPENCEDLGEIYGKSSSMSQEEAMVGAKNDLKNKAVKLGANYVLLETNNATTLVHSPVWPVEILLGGRALKCSETTTDKHCNSTYDCPGTKYCAPWGECASACKTDDDCAEGFACTSLGECISK